MKELLEHLQAYILISEEEFKQIETYFECFEVKKKQDINSFKNISNYNFFVVKGCLNMYFINDKGENQSVQFAIENWWISDLLSLHRNKKSVFFIQAVENCKILSISKKNQEKLLIEFPKIERYFRIIYQVALGASLYRIKFLYQASKAERYFHFIKHHPEFAQRIPQYLIASFLGLTPEYVSEIRAKNFS
ncbi:Crp/Fnr family transcriptional regulator [Reichenbachiella versicolor]|uniref:Crp/Fnr family transcriptional regulator n=1 Tax=Reichenbachiella versicolor TaxID=1821036 RepID=UPI001FE59C59|nr:Crp/Fnr family transcriptional regulator [Reichenbachiella versicolor]